MRSAYAIALGLAAAVFAQQPFCKTVPFDADWPSLSDWTALNASINGALIETRPAASSCYPGNPLNSPFSCAEVEDNWTRSEFQASLPEGIGYPFWANDSCLPPNGAGFLPDKGCDVGGSPRYVVNATSEEQIATAMRWAANRNIRVVVKGTGHDLNGRSSGAFALSIWTRNFRTLILDPAWPVPGSSNSTENVLIAGSGNNYGAALGYTLSANRVIIHGEDKTVGLGGHIQGGGHGPLSSTYGLAADQILQVRVVTTEGRILVADATQNQDLLWAVRGGGPGLYGVVTQFVLRTYPAPASVVSLRVNMGLIGNGSVSEAAAAASWNALGSLMRDIPDLMDTGIAGSGNVVGNGVSGGASLSVGFQAYNRSATELQARLALTVARMRAQDRTNGSLLTITATEPQTFDSYGAFFDNLHPGGIDVGQISLVSSRLLGRNQLTNFAVLELASWLQRAMQPANAGGSALMVIGLQAGPGPREVVTGMRGALNPVWRETYIHAIITGATVDYGSMAPQAALDAAAQWTEENREKVYRGWAPETGAYLNEANPYNKDFRRDFYGDSYDQLVQIKQKYDPTESLFILSGVGSNTWDYNLTSGKLCRQEPNDGLSG